MSSRDGPSPTIEEGGAWVGCDDAAQARMRSRWFLSGRKAAITAHTGRSFGLRPAPDGVPIEVDPFGITRQVARAGPCSRAYSSYTCCETNTTRPRRAGTRT